ncbi:MAG: mechanosensitive ion channel family protein [Oligoflexia bacterium]|nr:mechanosensitive ion channel family protein [Oligoflexia bacterium]
MNEADLTGVVDFVDVLSFTKVFMLIVGAILLVGLVKFVVSLGDGFKKRIPSKRLLIAQSITIISFLIYILGGIYLFYGVVRPPKSLLLAVSGTLAVALGLSLKDLVSSVVAGIILLFDRPFQVGDRISFNGNYGEIITIGLRAVRIVTLDDSIVTIPNSSFITDVVSSGNFGALDMLIETDFHLALGTDLEKAREVLYETAATSRYVFLKKDITIVMNEVAIAERLAVRFRVKCYVLDVRFEKALQSDITIRGNKALIEAKIERPALFVKTQG